MPRYKVVGVDSDGATLGITLQEVVPEGQVGDGFRVTIPVADWNAMTPEQQQEWLKARVQERIQLLEQAKALQDKIQQETAKYDGLKGTEVAV
jgi:predicted Fe-S protein YdhL (DUF1289 family)